MKILMIHNLHRDNSASGDDEVFKNETALLEQQGNKVIKYVVSNDEFDNASIFGKIVFTFGMIWSFKNYKKIQNIIKNEKPDIVHIHTFFPMLSPSVLYAVKRCGIKVVATLHDTRFICPCATSLNGTTLCSKCVDGHYLRMCKYSCYKDSRLQSFWVAIIFKYHRIRKSFYHQIDRYICLNQSQIQLLKEAGFDEKKIVKKYNFVSDYFCDLNLKSNTMLPERYVVFYGRISEEKGIKFLMKIWGQIEDIPLVVMGSGCLEKEFELWAEEKHNVYFLGYTQHDKCMSIVKKAEFVIFPSICYEGCSMVVLETESLGKGLIVTDIGFSAEAIANGLNGYKVGLGDDTGFVEKVNRLWNSPDECKRIGRNARKDYERKYLPENNYYQLIEIYNNVLEEDN